MIKLVPDVVNNVTLYIGPGVAILLVQVLIAVSIGALTMLSMYRAKVVTFLQRLRRKWFY